MRKILMIIVAIALLGSTMFFVLDEFGVPAKYDMTYYEYLNEVGVTTYMAWICRYLLAYPIGAILILLHVFKPVENL